MFELPVNHCILCWTTQDLTPSPFQTQSKARPQHLVCVTCQEEDVTTCSSLLPVCLQPKKNADL